MLLNDRKISSMITFCFLTASLITTSFGGAFVTSALAATPEVNNLEEKSRDNNGLIAGIATIGLIGLLSSHGGGSHGSAQGSPATADSSSSPKIPPPVVSPPVVVPPVVIPVPNTPPVSGGTATEEQHAFDLLNADRASNGLKALKFNMQLSTLGEKYAQDMINRNYFSHYNPEGQSPFDRMKQAGIVYSYAGENLAINSNVTTAERAFMNSPGHKANILSPNYTEVGLGVRYDAKGSVYVVQEFISK